MAEQSIAFVCHVVWLSLLGGTKVSTKRSQPSVVEPSEVEVYIDALAL